MKFIGFGILALAYICLSLAAKPDIIVDFDPSSFEDPQSYIKESIQKVWDSNAPQICTDLNVDCSKLNKFKRDYVVENKLFSHMHFDLKYDNTNANIPSGVVIQCTYPVEVKQESQKDRNQYVKSLQIVLWRKLGELLEDVIKNGQPKAPVPVKFAEFTGDVDTFISESKVKVWNENAPAIAAALNIEFGDVDAKGEVCPHLASRLFNDMTVHLDYAEGSTVPNGATIYCKFHIPSDWTDQDKHNYMKTLQVTLGKLLDQAISKSFITGKCKEPVVVIFPNNYKKLGTKKFAKQAIDIAWDSNEDDLAQHLNVDAKNIKNGKYDDVLASILFNQIDIKYFYDDGEWNVPKGMKITCCFSGSLDTDEEKLTYLKTLKYVIGRLVYDQINKSIHKGRDEALYITLLPEKSKADIQADVAKYVSDVIDVTVSTHLERLYKDYKITLEGLDATPVDFTLANEVVKALDVDLIYGPNDHEIPIAYSINCRFEHNPYKMTQAQRNAKIKSSIYLVVRIFTEKLLKSLSEGAEKPAVNVMFPVTKRHINKDNLDEYIEKLQEITWNSNIDLVSHLYQTDASVADEDTPNPTYEEDFENNVVLKLKYDNYKSKNPSGLVIYCHSKIDVTQLSEDEKVAVVNSLKHVIFEKLNEKVTDSINLGREKEDILIVLPEYTNAEFKEKKDEIKNIIYNSNKNYLADNARVRVKDIEQAGPVTPEVEAYIEENVTIVFDNTPGSAYAFKIFCNVRYGPALDKYQRAALARASAIYALQQIDNILSNLS